MKNVSKSVIEDAQRIRDLALVAERTTNAVIITDVQRRVRWVNDGFTKITGYTFDEAIGRCPADFLQSEDTDPVTVQKLRESLNRGEGCRVEILNRGKDGRRYWLDMDIRPIHDAHGVVEGFIAVEMDVTEQVESRQRLAAAERRLRLTVEGADLGTWDWHIPSGKVVFNDRWCEILGYKPEEIEGHVRSWELVLHPEDQKDAEQHLQDHFDRKTDIYRFEHRLKHKDGSVVWVLDSGRVYEWSDRGEPVRMAGIHLDITERRRAEERFELAATASVVGIWDRNLVTGTTYLSPRLYELLGHAKPEDRIEKLPSSLESLVHPEDREAQAEAEREHIDNGAAYEIELRLRTATGRYRWFQSRGEAVRNNDGDTIRMAGSLQDVHERKLLEISRAALAKIVETSEDAILSLDAHGRIRIANPGVTSMLGFQPGDLVGLPYQEILVDHDQSDALAKVLRGELDSMGGPLETRCRRQDGSEIEVSIAASPVCDENGSISGASMIVRDITDRREKVALQETTRELAELNQLLERQNHRLEDMTDRAHRFVDDVSHEFRTPLTVIKEYTSIILDGLGGEISSSQEDWLRIIDIATVDLNTMVEDFLDSSKLRSGRLRVERRRHDVATILGDIDRLLRRKAEANGIRLACVLADDLPQVFVDDEKARRVVVNLATNAIKFSPPDTEVRIEAVTNSQGDIEISICDQGAGISEADMHSLFERFQQLPNAMSPGVKGFGLGLNIARQLVWLNLGRLEVMNRPEGGACFRFTMPPAEPRVVVDRFFERLLECEDRPNNIGAIRITPTKPSYDLATMQRDVCSAIRPSDLCIEAGGEPGLLVFGPAGSASEWADRLGAEWAGDLGPSLRIGVVGDWEFDEDWRSAHREILELIGETVHA